MATKVFTGQTEKTNVEENMMAIRQEQSKYQEKQGDGDCTNNVNVAVKTVGSYMTFLFLFVFNV
jgi:hypothetical protein